MTTAFSVAGREEVLMAEIAVLRERLERETATARADHDRLTFELGHRVKNTLGVVQALANQTLRMAASPQDALETLNGRIIALANANDAVLSEGRTAASLRAVVSRLLVEPENEGLMVIDGPDLTMQNGAALSLCMALHELASNARRHGAWSSPEGRVALTWAIDGEVLALDWREYGGPPVDAPARSRFGLRLIQQSLRRAFGGDVTVAFEPEGFRCRVVAPLTGLKRQA